MAKKRGHQKGNEILRGVKKCSPQQPHPAEVRDEVKKKLGLRNTFSGTEKEYGRAGTNWSRRRTPRRDTSSEHGYRLEVIWRDRGEESPKGGRFEYSPLGPMTHVHTLSRGN